MKCYNCDKKGHISSQCTKPKKSKDKDKKKSKDDDEKSTSRKSSKAILKLRKDFKKTKKYFATMQSKIAELEEVDSDLSNSDDEAASHVSVQF